MKQKAFTLIELLVIIAILSLVAIVVIAALDPLEMIKRGRDAATQLGAENIYSAVIRSHTTTNAALTTNDISGEQITNAPALQVLQKLTESGELKSSFIANAQTKFLPLFLSLTPDLSNLNVCFAPISQEFRNRPEAKYDQAGNPIDCTSQTCHLCIITSPNLADADENGSQTIVNLQTEEAAATCENFNPENPTYAYTCNSSSKWAEYGCSNFCVTDMGCDSFCPPGSRHLKKSYYGTGMINFISCLSKTSTISEINEDYCVSGAAANCEQISHSSSSSDYIWGCENPMRPYDWKE